MAALILPAAPLLAVILYDRFEALFEVRAESFQEELAQPGSPLVAVEYALQHTLLCNLRSIPVAAITAQLVKELRDRTGAGFKECKDVLTEADGDIEKAIQLLKAKGLADAGKKQDREASEGRVEVYVHAGSRMAAMVEVNCETDFVARTDDFIALCKDIAIHIAATKPRYVRVEDVPADVLSSSDLSTEDFYKENVLLSQAFVRNASESISDKLQSAIVRLGENIVVRRFVRYEVGA